MNAKRWTAVVIAIGVFFSSLLFSFTVKFVMDSYSSSGIMDEFMIMMDAPGEIVLHEGALDERIAVIDVRGVIMDTYGGYFSGPQYNHQYTLSVLEDMKYDDSVKAILLRVDSPGGGVYESAELSDKIYEVKEARDIPLYVVMESMAASGGYYISAYADKIYGTKETITGSIGVIMSGFNYTGLLEKIGVEDMTIKSGAMKDVGSGAREALPEDIEVLQGLVDGMYERFVDVVAEGRQLDREYVYTLADGRIYDGVQAKENKLIDEIGYYEDALQNLMSAYELENAQVVMYTPMEQNFISQWFMGMTEFMNFGSEIQVGNVEIPSSWKENSGFMYMYRGY